MLIQQLTNTTALSALSTKSVSRFPKGKVLSLIGPNGAGKSTVMGMISRLVAKDAGAGAFEGKDLAQWNSRDLSKRLAILTQSNNIQMKLTVRELVSFGRFPYSQGRLQEEDRRKWTKRWPTWSWKSSPINLSTSCPAGSGSGR